MKEMEEINYSVVIPTYNSTGHLIKLLQRINQVFLEVIKESYEIIFIDDGSENPETWETLKKLQRGQANLTIIQLSKNFGQHAATLCGIKEAKGRYIVTMDDDLQHYPEDIPLLLEQKDHDIVIGRFQKKKHSLFKRVTSRIKGWFDRILIGKPKSIRLTPFRLLKTSIAKGMLLIKTPYPFIPALMFHISKDIVNVDVRHGKSMAGKSTYSLLKMISIFSNLLINNSAFLLRLIGGLGIGVSSISFLIGIYLIVRKLVFNLGVIGWTSTVVSVLFIGGLILFSIGVIGEYLIRIVRTTEQKPTYFIREKSGPK